MSGDESSRPPESEFREYLGGNLPNQDTEPDAYWFTGLIPNPRIRHLLAFCEEIYEPVGDMPKEFKDTQFARDTVRKYGTDVGTDALLFNNMGYLNFFSGLVGYQKDVSGMQVLMSLQNMIRNTPVFISYIQYLAKLLG